MYHLRRQHMTLLSSLGWREISPGLAYLANLIQKLLIPQPPSHECRGPGAIGDAMDVIDALGRQGTLLRCDVDVERQHWKARRERNA